MKSETKARHITLRIEAYTDPAGKYDATAPLNGNEDNFFVSNHGDANGIVKEPPQGMLIAVADGMGGLNAGEVASKLAIDTVTEAFTPEKISAMASHNGPTRQVYLERIIRQADARIKEAQRQNPAQANMGSTIVLAWLMGNELVVSWCGDSRAYLYNAVCGLRLISHDHSYVQELVDSGVITYEQAFDHPQNNIVTRSLGDPQHEAKPDSVRLTMSKGDVLMVCSDGLTGVLRDKKAYDAKNNPLPEMNMEDIFRAATTLKECREKLWEAASKSGWYDNVTAVLCEMVEGPQAPIVAPAASSVPPAVVVEPVAPAKPASIHKSVSTPKAKSGNSVLRTILIMIVIALLGVLAWLIFVNKDDSDNQPTAAPQVETGAGQDGESDNGNYDHYNHNGYQNNGSSHRDKPANNTPQERNDQEVDGTTGAASVLPAENGIQAGDEDANPSGGQSTNKPKNKIDLGTGSLSSSNPGGKNKPAKGSNPAREGNEDTSPKPNNSTEQ